MACYNCGNYGHQKKNCPTIRCYKCNRLGHISASCPRSCVRDRHRCRWEKNDPKSSSEAQEEVTVDTAAVQKTKELHLKKEHSTVTFFFERYPSLDRTAGLNPRCRTSSVSSRSSQTSSEPSSPVLPVMVMDMCSDIRSSETVKRVSETIYKLRRNDTDSFCILTDKKFEQFQEDKSSDLFSIPKKEEDLQRGDFDIILIHSSYGYIHLEVKAFGDAQDHLGDNKKRQELVKVLRQRAVNEMQKGRRALQYLQPPDHAVSIVTTLALPNIPRDFLRLALQENPDLRQTLAQCISPSVEDSASVPVESLCLCSDDLPPKDGIVDEANVAIREAVNKWWGHVTALGAVTKLSSHVYRYILAGFLHSEDVKNFPERVYDTGEKFKHLCLDEQQANVIKSNTQYAFITGPPGCGKSLVLAEKTVQWLRKEMNVFILYAHKRITNQPATEFLRHVVQSVAKLDQADVTSLLRRFHQRDISKLNATEQTRMEDFFNEIMEIKNDPSLGQTPRSPKHKSEDAMFKEVSGPAEELENMFTAQALIDAQKEQAHQPAERGDGIRFVIDEFQMRTTTEGTTDLLHAIKKQFPEAQIWCAGPLPAHCPGNFFHTEHLSYPYRCPPSTQRLLQAMEPFCQNENERQPVFSYVTSSTNVPSSGVASGSEGQNRLPEDGPDPIFISHYGHGIGEIVDCKTCAHNLTQYLKNVLKIGQTNSSGKSLEESDVLIVVSGTSLYYNMHSLKFTELYRQLTSDRVSLKVNIYEPSDTFQLDKPGVCMMHCRLVAGMEKKVVIFVPSQQYQDRQMTNEEAVRRRSVPEWPPRQQQSSTSQGALAFDPNSQKQSPVPQAPDQRQSITAPRSVADQKTLTGDHPGSEQATGSDSAASCPELRRRSCPIEPEMADRYQREVRETLQRCQTLTAKQCDKLARLGKLNLHWLWYTASRSLAHNIVFHF